MHGMGASHCFCGLQRMQRRSARSAWLCKQSHWLHKPTGAASSAERGQDTPGLSRAHLGVFQKRSRKRLAISYT